MVTFSVHLCRSPSAVATVHLRKSWEMAGSKREVKPAAPSAEALLARIMATDDNDATTSRILDAALQHIETFGLRATTIEGVARRARLARKTIYRRFANKHALIEAVFWREAGRVFTEVEATVSKLPSIEERLVEGFVMVLVALRRHRLLDRVLTTEPDIVLPYLTTDAAPGLRVAHLLLVDRIRRFQPDGHQGDFDTELVSELLLRVGHSYVLTRGISVPLEDDERVRDFAHHLLGPVLGLDERPVSRAAGGRGR
jgi:AcrR family transcriptional regulator